MTYNLFTLSYLQHVAWFAFPYIMNVLPCIDVYHIPVFLVYLFDSQFCLSLSMLKVLLYFILLCNGFVLEVILCFMY